MTSSNGNNIRVTGPLCGEFTDLRWIPLINAELWFFFDVRLNKRLSKMSKYWPSRSLWRHYNEKSPGESVISNKEDLQHAWKSQPTGQWHVDTDLVLAWVMCVLILLCPKRQYRKEMQKKPLELQNIHLDFRQCCFGLPDYRPNSTHWMERLFLTTFFNYSIWFILPLDFFCPPFPYVVAMECSLSHIQLISYFITPHSFNLKMILVVAAIDTIPAIYG